MRRIEWMSIRFVCPTNDVNGVHSTDNVLQVNSGKLHLHANIYRNKWYLHWKNANDRCAGRCYGSWQNMHTDTKRLSRHRSTGNGNDRMAYGRHEIWHMQVLQTLLMAFFLLVKLPPFRNCLCWWVIERIFQLHTVCHSKECFETHCHLALHMCLKYGLFLCCWHLTSTGSIKNSSNKSKIGGQTGYSHVQRVYNGRMGQIRRMTSNNIRKVHDLP